MQSSIRIAAAVLAFVAGGCGSSRAASGGPSSTMAAAASSSTSVPLAGSPAPSGSAAAPSSAATVSATPATTATAPATTATTPSTTAVRASVVAPDFPSLKDCITRRWLLVADQADNVFDGSAMQRLPGFSQITTGEGPIEFRSDGTYTYTPNFEIQMTFNGLDAQGAWSGTLTGAWSATDTTLAMTPTDNAVTGTVSIFGSTQPLPQPLMFNGQAQVISCQPGTLTYEILAPSGAFRTTLVGA
jgi:hypothetical protein